MDGIDEILRQQRAERDEVGERLMQALRDSMPWGLEVDLGLGRKAHLVPMNGKPDGSQPRRIPIVEGGTAEAGTGEIMGLRPWSFSFDFQLENCDQDHIEVSMEISGGGGFV